MRTYVLVFEGLNTPGRGTVQNERSRKISRTDNLFFESNFSYNFSKYFSSSLRVLFIYLYVFLFFESLSHPCSKLHIIMIEKIEVMMSA